MWLFWGLCSCTPWTHWSPSTLACRMKMLYSPVWSLRTLWLKAPGKCSSRPYPALLGFTLYAYRFIFSQKVEGIPLQISRARSLIAPSAPCSPLPSEFCLGLPIQWSLTMALFCISLMACRMSFHVLFLSSVSLLCCSIPCLLPIFFFF